MKRDSESGSDSGGSRRSKSAKGSGSESDSGSPKPRRLGSGSESEADDKDAPKEEDIFGDDLSIRFVLRLHLQVAALVPDVACSVVIGEKTFSASQSNPAYIWKKC